MEERQKAKTRNNKSFKELVKIYGGGFCFALLIMVVAYQFVEPAPPGKVTIATAGKDGAYYAFAQQYRKLFAEEGIDLQVRETSGSVENLGLLAENTVQIAFLQGGVGSPREYPELEGLASLYLEPLWIFVRNEIEVTSMLDLEGKCLGVGPEGSGTRKVAIQLLEDNKLLEAGKVDLLPVGGREAARMLGAGDIDALFLVTRPGSPLVMDLVNNPRVTLVDLVRAESYSRLHSYLSHVVLPEGVLDMEKNIPNQDINLIAPAATLVTNGLLHPALSDLFMQAATKVHQEATILHRAKKFPSPENLDFQLSKEADRFYRNGPPFLQRYLPFWAASLIDRLKLMILPLIALIIPLAKILPPTYHWRMRSRIYRWYDELHQLDLHTRENPAREVIDSSLATLENMEEDVRQVEVPLSYSEELYHLRLHIELLRNQFNRLQPGE